MQYQDMLVHIDDGEAMPGRLAVAVELAERFGAHLTGIYVDPMRAAANRTMPICRAPTCACTWPVTGSRRRRKNWWQAT